MWLCPPEGRRGTIIRWILWRTGSVVCTIYCLKLLLILLPSFSPQPQEIDNDQDERHSGHKGISQIDTIPTLLDQGINMPDVLYHSILTLKKATGERKVNLGNFMLCQGAEECRALRYLHQGFGDVILDLDLYEYHLSFLRQRHLAATPRPKKCQGCFGAEYRNVITPEGVCNGEDNVNLIILITSTPSEVDARRALRETWLGCAVNNTGPVRYLFLFGVGWGGQEQRQLEQESRLHHDILQQDYVDNYYNLAYKVVSGFRYVTENCQQARYVVRTATDNYLSMARITQWLRLQESQRPLMGVQIGRCIAGRTRPNRRVWSRHYQTAKDFPGMSYPPYCVGTTYIFHILTMQELLRAAPHVPYFNMEDVWVGLVMEAAGVRVYNAEGFNVQYYPGPDVKRYRKWRVDMGVCNYTDSMLTLHRVTPDDIRAVHRLCIDKNKANLL